ncbi:MAG: Rieske 2Fe-2S domain-containing protein [Acidobacteria bacterium]|nr:Rieske 2Fe-2S domain-containing protein [Acidobacteriota bacterium]
MGQYKRALGVSDLQPGHAVTVAVDGIEVAVFNVDGRFYALQNACPHRGGPLGDGDLEGSIVTCPWHGWEWDVTSGSGAEDASVKTKAYQVKVEGDEVLVLVE